MRLAVSEAPSKVLGTTRHDDDDAIHGSCEQFVFWDEVRSAGVGPSRLKHCRCRGFTFPGNTGEHQASERMGQGRVLETVFVHRYFHTQAERRRKEIWSRTHALQASMIAGTNTKQCVKPLIGILDLSCLHINHRRRPGTRCMAELGSCTLETRLMPRLFRM